MNDPEIYRGERVVLTMPLNPFDERYVLVEIEESIDDTSAADTPEDLRRLARALEDYARELTRAAVVLRVRAAGRTS